MLRRNIYEKAAKTLWSQYGSLSGSASLDLHVDTKLGNFYQRYTDDTFVAYNPKIQIYLATCHSSIGYYAVDLARHSSMAKSRGMCTAEAR